ncbi:MAG TPA: Spy/CpxP family protein refolding chaperone [Pyrinomonadaceae bacterium]|nr:Spy/CpxP family protein refolding chaperone [Pyrinomonadaceae bacterium]
MKLNVKSLATAISLVILAALPLCAQTPPPEPPGPMQGRNGGGDPIRELNLTPEQREQIRMIREQNRAERATINQRVRETNRALEEALDSDNPDQSVLEQRIQEVSTAQAEAMRMRIKTEVKIRNVLTSEQRTMLKEMRRNVHQLRERRREDGVLDRQRRLEQRTRRLERRRNQPPPGSQGNANQQRPQEW